MVPYQLSEPLTFQPAAPICPETRAASPRRPELLNTVTSTSPRCFICGAGFLAGLGFAVTVGEGTTSDGAAVGVEAATTAWSAPGWLPPEAKYPTPATSTAAAPSSASGVGRATPRWSGEQPAGRMAALRSRSRAA